jgi:hypothetical protein
MEAFILSGQASQYGLSVYLENERIDPCKTHKRDLLP